MTDLISGVDRTLDSSSPSQPPLITAAWVALWLLRLWLILMLTVYGWSKVLLVQMGQADYGDALVQFGEMSPMGLLWRFMAYSPVFQCLSGLAEVLAAVLLCWRRTVAVGALLGAFDMGFVFLLNLAFDVPVKQLSLAMAIGCLIVAVPYLRRWWRAAGSGPIPAGVVATAVPWPKLHRFTRWLGPALALLMVLGSGAAMYRVTNRPASSSPLPGVYRVVQDSKPAAAQLADDDRVQPSTSRCCRSSPAARWRAWSATR